MRVQVYPILVSAITATLDNVVFGKKPLSSGRGPGRKTVIGALTIEMGLFLWTMWGLTIQWPVSVTLAGFIALVLVLEMATGPRVGSRSRPSLMSAAIGFARVLDFALAALLALLLFFITAQGALAGKGILPIIAVPLVLSGVLYLDVGLPLFLTLTLVLILALGVLMDAGPVVLLAVPLVISLGIGATLFGTLSPGRGAANRRALGLHSTETYHQL